MKLDKHTLWIIIGCGLPVKKIRQMPVGGGHGVHMHEGSPKGDEHQRQVKYQCPMKCEVDKTYDEPGNLKQKFIK